MKASYYFLWGFLVCAAIFTFTYFIVGTAVYGDGRYYYTIVHSAVVDHDLYFANEYEYYKINERTLPTGFVANKYPLGASIVWLVPFSFVHSLAKLGGNIGSGYTWSYQFSVGLTSIALGIGGWFFIFRSLKKYFDTSVSLVGSVTAVFATNAAFYISYDVINSHAVSFFFASLFLYLLVSKKNYLLVGLTAGMLALARTQDILWLGLPLILILWEEKKLVSKVKEIAIMLSSFAAVFSLQIFYWKVIYGTYSTPYLGSGEGFNFLNPQIFGLLFNGDTGLVWWTPWVFLSLLVYLLSRNPGMPRVFKLGKIYILLLILFISSWSSWNQGAAFGTRMLISGLPLMSWGFAEIFNHLRKKKTVGVILSLGMILVNQILMVFYLVTH